MCGTELFISWSMGTVNYVFQKIEMEGLLGLGICTLLQIHRSMNSIYNSLVISDKSKIVLEGKNIIIVVNN